jgi:uncharacterized membrane protein HdeD (DUF308 family)
MKSCPTCNRTYPDDTLAFCLMDGSVLSAPYDPVEAKRGLARDDRNSAPTEVLRAAGTPVETTLPSGFSIPAPVVTPGGTQPPLQSTIFAPAPQVPKTYSEERPQRSLAKQGSAPALFRWALILRGFTSFVFGVLFGVLFLVGPVRIVRPFSGSIESLAMLFGAYALVSGTLALVAGIKAYGSYKSGWLLLMDGISSAGAGMLLFVAVVIRFHSLFMIPASALVTGAFQVGAAFQLRKHVTGTSLLLFAGLVSMLFGLLLSLD